MSWVVESLQSKLDEVQSSIDSRLLETNKKKSEEEPEEDVAWPSLGPGVSNSPVGDTESRNVSDALNSCEIALSRAESGARELELRLVDFEESRDVRVSGRKALFGKMKALKNGEANGAEVASAVAFELEESARRGKELEKALSRALETIGKPAMSAKRDVAQMKVAYGARKAPWRLARSALRHRGLVLSHTRKMKQGALYDELRAFKAELEKSQGTLVANVEGVERRAKNVATRFRLQNLDVRNDSSSAGGIAAIDRLMDRVRDEAASAVLEASKRESEAGDAAALKAELATATRRASEASSVAKEALAELDRERSNRKNRELSSLKTLNEQLKATRLEAREARSLVADLSAQLDAETDAHLASRAVVDCHVASASGLRAEIAQLADKMVAAFSSSRSSEQRCRELQRRLDEMRIEKDRRIESLDATLRETRREMMEQQNASKKNTNSRHGSGLAHKGGGSAEVMESGMSQQQTMNGGVSAVGRKQTGAKYLGLRTMSRLLFVVYALALHILVYASYHRCGLTSSAHPDIGGGSSSGAVPPPRLQ